MIELRNRAVVPYYRVSTDKQGKSGLGLEAQQAAVEAFCKRHGLTLEAPFVEIESGRKNDRPQLAAAFAAAQKIGGAVIVAKLDRLARSVSKIVALMDGQVGFVAVDQPDASRFVLHILAAVAEEQARMIGENTKAALAAAKARGVKLGCPNPSANGAKGRETMRARGQENRAALRDRVSTLHAEGKSLRQIAKEIGCGTMTVQRILRG